MKEGICQILSVFWTTTKISEGYLEFNCMMLKRASFVVGIRPWIVPKNDHCARYGSGFEDSRPGVLIILAQITLQWHKQTNPSAAHQQENFLDLSSSFSCSNGSETWCMGSFCMIANEESLWHDIMLPKPPRVSVETIALGSGWTVWPTLWSSDCQGCASPQFLPEQHTRAVHGFEFLSETEQQGDSFGGY